MEQNFNSLKNLTYRFPKNHIPWNKNKKTGIAYWSGKKHPKEAKTMIDIKCKQCGKSFKDWAANKRNFVQENVLNFIIV